MNRISPPTDEHIVVAFLSGINEQRHETALVLARALLCTAQEVLEALGFSSAPSSPTPNLATRRPDENSILTF